MGTTETEPSELLISMKNILFFLLVSFYYFEAVMSSGYAVECDTACEEWTAWSSTSAGLMQERTRSCSEKRTDPSRNIGGTVMESVRYPPPLKARYLTYLKSKYC